MDLPRKTRPEALLLEQDEPIREQIYNWLRTPGLSYPKVRALIGKEYGIVVRSDSTLSKFWELFCAPRVLAERQLAKQSADTLAEAATREPGNWDQAIIEALKQSVWELMQPNARPATPEQLDGLLKILLKVRGQDQRSESLALAKEKYRDSLRTKMEAGLGALFEEIKGNEKAVTIFEQLKASMAEAKA